MTIRKTDIDNSWQAISATGESGTCWAQKKPLRGQIVLSHTDTGDTGILKDNEAYYLLGESRDIINITADNENDIFYVKCIEIGETAVIISDME